MERGILLTSHQDDCLARDEINISYIAPKPGTD